MQSLSTGSLDFLRCRVFQTIDYQIQLALYMEPGSKIKAWLLGVRGQLTTNHVAMTPHRCGLSSHITSFAAWGCLVYWPATGQ